MTRRGKSWRSTRRSTRRTRRKPNVNQITFRNASSVAQAAYGAYKGFNILKGIINSEIKRFDSNNSVGMTSTPTIVNLNQIAAGDDANQRNGNSILAKYVILNYNVLMNVATATAACRVMIVVDTENTGTDPTAAQILQNSAATYNVSSPINIDNTARFTILADQKFTLSNTGNQSVIRKVYRKLNFHIKFTTTATTGFQKNSVYIMFMSTSATNEPIITWQTRVAYYDN